MSPDLSLVFEYLHPEQKGRVLTGYKLFRFLRDGGKLSNSLSHGELLILREFGAERLRSRFRAPTLTAWRSADPWAGVGHVVPVLLLYQDSLPISWCPLSGAWAEKNPAALFI
jgi:hypothetical protein